MTKGTPDAKRRAPLAKGWTQERIGEVLGVARTTVELWLASRTNDRAVNASTPKDCRIKLSKEHQNHETQNP